MPDDTIGLYFVPEDEGAHVIGIPARDLTAAEVEQLRQREPAAMHTATTPGPNGRALYQPTKPSGKRAEAAKTNRATVAAGPAISVPDAPAEDGDE